MKKLCGFVGFLALKRVLHRGYIGLRVIICWVIPPFSNSPSRGLIKG